MDRHERFGADPASIRAARRFATGVLRHAGRGELVDTVALVVSELATNAVRHAGTPFEVDVRVADDVVIGVTDTGPGTPVRRQAGTAARTGRGLAIVESLSRAWGVEVRRPGKRVWCALGADEHERRRGDGGAR